MSERTVEAGNDRFWRFHALSADRGHSHPDARIGARLPSTLCAEAAAVVTYIRVAWENSGTPVAPTQASELRTLLPE